MTHRPRPISRRALLAGLGAAGAAVAAGLGGRRAARSDPGDTPPPVFLITLGAFGGASIIDSFLPFTHRESPNPETVNCFPEIAVVQPPGSNLRAVRWAGNLFGPYTTDLSAFLAKHKEDMLVATMTGTSVNHTVAQKRAITGNGAWAGRTLQEAVAAQHGEAFPLPNVNMSSHGFAAHGDDASVAAYARMEPVAIPALWPLALHGSRGVKIETGDAVLDGPSPELLALARKARDTRLDPLSSFYTTFQRSERLQRYKRQRNELLPAIEDADLITKLNMLTESPDYPLGKYGLASSPDVDAVREAFPRLTHDPLHAQAALGFLLVVHGVSVCVTLGPNFNLTLGDLDAGEPLILNPPLSFDNSHTSHRDTQAFMWQRMLDVADGLITLLKSRELGEGSGQSYWDRTMLYCATDFGRSKGRTSLTAAFGSGHDLNNGVLAISPMLKGNRVLGGVHTGTGMTYGFDPETGAPDPDREMAEAEIYAGLCHAMGLDTSGAGLPPVTAFAG